MKLVSVGMETLQALSEKRICPAASVHILRVASLDQYSIPCGHSCTYDTDSQSNLLPGWHPDEGVVEVDALLRRASSFFPESIMSTHLGRMVEFVKFNRF